ncbi:hypothetical protein [Porphyromonas macacae]|uniref:hypothetical protein n=1 Tax=Porphyromonas macacae TaxID=28115 RepID=UPI0024AE298B|nr:hypothetical protein [Porphyromonas macacae]
MSKFKYFPVNWVQGMSISPEHFVNTENFFMERILRYNGLSLYPDHYGLLPMTDEKSSVGLRISGMETFGHVFLDSYSGFTPGGYLIQFSDSEEAVSCPFPDANSFVEEGWDIVLSVSPYERVPSGNPDVHEEPPRYPYVMPSISLHLIPRNGKINTYDPFSVVVGLLRKNEAGYMIDGNFIPPSLFMASHQDLRHYMGSFTKTIGKIDSSVRKIVEKAQAQASRTSEAESVLLLSKEVLRSISSLNFDWINRSYSLTPYQVIQTLTSFAGSILTGLCFLGKKEREEVLKYFYEWNGIAPATFEQQLAEVIHKPYNHNRINHSMVMIKGILDTLEELFGAISRLEFVGQHKEGIVISERRIQDTSSTDDHWTLVD